LNGLTSLQYLDLAKNEIKSIDAAAFNGLLSTMIQISLCHITHSMHSVPSNDISLIYQSVFTGTCVENTCRIKICNSLFVDFFNSKNFLNFYRF
jgi:hypothetical protein